jgi:hypothetical protein
MKTLLTVMMLGVVLTFGMQSTGNAVTSEPNPPAGAPATSAPPPERGSPGVNIIKGEVLKIGKGNYVIKDMAGKALRLKVDAGTRIEGDPKVGDRIEAEMSSKRRAASIKKMKTE